MKSKSLSEWLSWQESLNTAEIDLGLDRVQAVLARLPVKPPAGRVFTVAGTNGKGSCAAALEAILRANGLRTGLYTSPHLVAYNERVCVANQPVADDLLVSAFEQIEAVRGDTALTFFEYGTLAAMLVFSAQQCDAWVLEVGLGGRLDAVNVIDADIAIISTVALDHQDWLGESLEEIAFEKAGIMRAGRPAFYGDAPVPESLSQHAQQLAAEFKSLNHGYTCTPQADSWAWQGNALSIDGLQWPAGATDFQIRNQGLALAAIEACDPHLLADKDAIRTALGHCAAPGRLQELQQAGHTWLLDVAHNPQAATGLAKRLEAMQGPVTVVIGMLADKRAADFVAEFRGLADSWITCPIDTRRGSTASTLAALLEAEGIVNVRTADSVPDALGAACDTSPAGGCIVVCGSFYVVGPALRWLGLY